ncbi:TIGR03564 family F420-dependent LLM class oxidoreductase [Nocardiopsis trehalosi]|jgi:F420-dependent oxidoreductase-like protein|uniref:TIGR03564 family F420-dependent LLM class oxidoreductase n=1 Tax=Nocardiopsis trehalosi TaxID=109329 RepID=UPI000834DA29|nr:TIGR03564 family F420-dependent LLM class oxidoreductase [Nocardiopsis trehalosi]
MRMGIWLSADGTPEEVAASARAAAEAGYTTAWVGENGGWDPLTLFAAIGRAAPGIDLGTSVVRSHARHPLALAAQALTAQAATGGRIVLGIGPSHAAIIEGSYGLSFAAPEPNLRDYLAALAPLLRGEAVEHRGPHWTAVGGPFALPGATPPPVLISALGPRMLRLAGEATDGTVLTWSGPALIADEVVPALARGADAAGRPRPRVVAGVCVSVTADPDRVRADVDAQLGVAGGMPSYRAVLDRQGLASVGATVLAGDEEEVARGLRRYADAGTTEFMAIPMGSAEERERTTVLLPGLAA